MDWTVIGGIIGGFFTLAGTWYVAKRTGKSASESTAVTWSKDLVTRIETLEKRDEEKNARIDGLQDQQRETTSMLSTSLGYIENLVHDLHAAGVSMVRRPPAELREKLAHLFDKNDRRDGH